MSVLYSGIELMLVVVRTRVVVILGRGSGMAQYGQRGSIISARGVSGVWDSHVCDSQLLKFGVGEVRE